MPTGTSRRTRAGAGTPAELRIGGGSYPCQAENASLTGVLVRGSLPSTCARHVEVELTLAAPGANADLRVTVRGRIVRADVDGASGMTRLGIEFVDLSAKTTAALESLIARLLEGHVLGPLAELPDHASPAEVQAALGSIPLAQRVRLASRAQALERGRLMLDPQLAVIDALARNPSLVLPELLAILRRPGLLPQTLEVIGRDPRWAANDQVRVLVAGHPATPMPLAESLAAALSGPALELLIRAPGLRPTLRDKVLHRLPRKTSGPRSR